MALKKILIALSASAALAGCSKSNTPTTSEGKKPTPGSVDNSDNAKQCFEAMHLLTVARDEKRHGVCDDSNVEAKKSKKHEACTGNLKTEADKWAEAHSEDASHYKNKHPTFTEQIEKCYINYKVVEEAVSLAGKFATKGMTTKLQEALKTAQTCEIMFIVEGKQKKAYDKERRSSDFTKRMDKRVKEAIAKQEESFVKSLSADDKEALMTCYENSIIPAAGLSPKPTQAEFNWERTCRNLVLLGSEEGRQNDQLIAKINPIIRPAGTPLVNAINQSIVQEKAFTAMEKHDSSLKQQMRDLRE